MFQPHTGNTNTTGSTVDTTVAVPRVLDISLDAVGSVEQGDGVALAGLCTVFTKASTAAALTDGPRLENLAWRLWGRARVPAPAPLKSLSPVHHPTHPVPALSPHHSPSLHPHPVDTGLTPNPHPVSPSPNLPTSQALVPSISASTVTSVAGQDAYVFPSSVTYSNASIMSGSGPTSTFGSTVMSSSGLISTSGSPSASASASEATVPSTSITVMGRKASMAADSLALHDHHSAVGPLSPSSCPNSQQSAVASHSHSTSQYHQPLGSHHYLRDNEGQQNEQGSRENPALVPVILPMNHLSATDAMNMDSPEAVPVTRSKPHHFIAVHPHDPEPKRHSLLGSTSSNVHEHMERHTIKGAEGAAHTHHHQDARPDTDAEQEQNERQRQHALHPRMSIALPVTRSGQETRPDLGRDTKTQAQHQELCQDQALRHRESHEGVAEEGVTHIVVHPIPNHHEAEAVGGCLTPGPTPEFEHENVYVVEPASQSKPNGALKPGFSFGNAIPSDFTGVTGHEDLGTYNIATDMGRMRTTTQAPTTTMNVGFAPASGAPASGRISVPLPLKQGAPTLARLIKRLFGDVSSRGPLSVVESGTMAHVHSTSPASTSTASATTSTPTSTPSTSATTASFSSTAHSIEGVAPVSCASIPASARPSPTIRSAPFTLPFPTVVVVNPTPHPTPPATPSPPCESNTYFRYSDTNGFNTSGTLNDTPFYNISPSVSTPALRDGSLSGSLANEQLATPTSIDGDAKCGNSETFAGLCNVSANETSQGGRVVPVTHAGISSDTSSTGSGHASIERDSLLSPRLSSTSMLSRTLLPVGAILTEATSAAASSDTTLTATISTINKPSPSPVTAPTSASTSAPVKSTPKTVPPSALSTPVTSSPRTSVPSVFHASITSSETTTVLAPSTTSPSAPASITSAATTSSVTSTAVSTSTPPFTSVAPIPPSSVVEDKKFFLAAPHSIGSGGSEHSSESPDSVGGRFGKKEMLGREVLLGKGKEGTLGISEVGFYKAMAGRKASHEGETIMEKMGGMVRRENEVSGSMSTNGSPGSRTGLTRGVSSPTLGKGKGRIVGAGRRKGMKKSAVVKDERTMVQGQVGAEEGKVETQKTLERDQNPEREDIKAKGKSKQRDLNEHGDGSRSSGAITELVTPAPASAARLPLATVKSMQQLPSHRSHTHSHPPTHLHGQHSNALPHTNVHGQGHPHLQLHQAHHLRQLPTNPPRRHHSPARRPVPIAANNAESGHEKGHPRRNDKGSMRSPPNNTGSSHSSHALMQEPAMNTRHLPFHPQLSHLGLGHLPTVPPKQRRPIEITETSSEYETTDTDGDESSWESESVDRKGEDSGAGAKEGEGIMGPSKHNRNAEEVTKNENANSNGQNAIVAGATTNSTNNLRTRDAGEFARDAALEAQKQRDMFQKLPVRSYSNLGHLSRVKSGLSILFNPDPENFPQGHPYRTSRNSRDILARNWSAPGPPLVVGRASAVAPMQAAVNAEPVVSSVNSRGSTTGVPGRSQDGHSGVMRRGGYRPRVKPADQEEETDSGDDDPEDAIQVSSSVAQRRLAAIMGSRGTQSQQHSRRPSPSQATSNPSIATTSQGPARPSQLLSRMTTAPVLMMHPYLPDPAPLQTPHTVRRNIISQELDEELRRNLLWERSQNQIQGRPPRAPGSILQGPWRPLSSLKPEEGDETQPQVNASDKAPGKRPFVTQRTKSWAGDFHASGW